MNEIKPQWEEELRLIINRNHPFTMVEFWASSTGFSIKLREELKALVSNLLKTTEEECQDALAQMNEAYNEQRKIDKKAMKAELIKKIEGLKYTKEQGIDNEMASHNRALDSVINIIKE